MNGSEEPERLECPLGREYIDFCLDAWNLGVSDDELEYLAGVVREYGLTPEEARDYLACFYAWYYLNIDYRFYSLLYLLYTRFGAEGCEALLEIPKRVEKIREKLHGRVDHDKYLEGCRDVIDTRYRQCVYLAMYPLLLAWWHRVLKEGRFEQLLQYYVEQHNDA